VPPAKGKKPLSQGPAGGATQLVLFEPASDWTPPEHLPSLAGARYISFDTETYDPELLTFGPGGVRGSGYVVGVSIATDDGFCAYLPIRHQGGGNLPRGPVIKWLNEELNRPNQPKVGANVLYDLEWLAAEGVKVTGPFYDVQNAEPLLNENRLSFSLDNLARDHCKTAKDEALLRDAVAALFGPKASVKDRLWELPAKYVGPYAEADAKIALEVFLKQRPLLEKDELWDLFLLESRLVPMLHAMRMKGVRVDLETAERRLKDIRAKKHEAQCRLNSLAGQHIQVWANDSVAAAFNHCGEQFPLTGTGKPSFEKVWLKNSGSPVSKAVLEVRRYDSLGERFIEEAILQRHCKGRLHTQFNQLRKDDSGTVSGRFSSCNPNLQQVPARDEEVAPLIRGLFIPEDGCDWWSNDFSQIEFRVLVHYAALRGFPKADVAKAMYNRDPSTDFHQMASELTGKDRKTAKNINFGLVYGMGLAKLARSLGLAPEEAKPIFAEYHGKLPFIRGINEEIMRLVGQRGYIKTILNRRRRFPLFESKDQMGSVPLPYEDACAQYGGAGRIRRAMLHKALNSLVQGSAADIMKQSMVDTWESGVYAELNGCPTLTVHDELDGSLPRTKGAREALAEVHRIMTTCVKMEVPVMVDCEVGADWGHVKAFDFEVPFARGNAEGGTLMYDPINN